VVLPSTSTTTNASLLNDDSIGYSMDLMTTSGNGIIASGTLVPGGDVFCWEDATGPCPPADFLDRNFFGSPEMFGIINVRKINIPEIGEFSVIDLVLGDALFTPGTPEYLWGSFTFFDLGWGLEEGKVVGAATCDPATLTGTNCDFIGTSVWTDTSFTITIAELDALELGPFGPDYRAVTLTNIVDAEHIPVPSSILLLGLGLAGLGWSRRKKA
jgi:hypothetical protein